MEEIGQEIELYLIVLEVGPKKKSVNLRNPNSIRPWQHILDALNGYLLLAKINSKSKILMDNLLILVLKKLIKTVKELCDIFKIYWPGKQK